MSNSALCHQSRSSFPAAVRNVQVSSRSDGLERLLSDSTLPGQARRVRPPALRAALCRSTAPLRHCVLRYDTGQPRVGEIKPAQRSCPFSDTCACRSRRLRWAWSSRIRSQQTYESLAHPPPSLPDMTTQSQCTASSSESPSSNQPHLPPSFEGWVLDLQVKPEPTQDSKAVTSSEAPQTVQTSPTDGPLRLADLYPNSGAPPEFCTMNSFWAAYQSSRPLTGTAKYVRPGREDRHFDLLSVDAALILSTDVSSHRASVTPQLESSASSALKHALHYEQLAHQFPLALHTSTTPDCVYEDFTGTATVPLYLQWCDCSEEPESKWKVRQRFELKVQPTANGAP